MTFEPISLFEFEPLNPQKAAREHEYLTFAKTNVWMSDKLFERLGNPQYVSVGIDAANKMIGVRNATSKKSSVFAVRKYDGCYGAYIVASQIILDKVVNVAGINPKKYTYRATPNKVIDGYLTFDLTNVEERRKSTRAKREK